MTEEQIEAILKSLSQRMSDEENDSIFYGMRDATKAIRAWQAMGEKGEIPHAVDLRRWGILKPAETLTTHAPVKQEEKPPKKERVHNKPRSRSDPDDDLREAFDEALTLLNNERYLAARNAFTMMQPQATGRLLGDVTRYYEEAEAQLAKQVRGHIEKAESHAEMQPNDYKGQRGLWNRVREVEPENETARLALQRLDEMEQVHKTGQDIEQLRKIAATALQNLRLAELNHCLGEAETLQQNNTVSHLQPALDELVQHISRQRDQLRSQLGSSSTLAVSGNLHEAYRQARKCLDQGVTAVFDQAGILGEAGKDVDSYLFFHDVRRHFIASLRDLAQQRLSQAEGQKGADPNAALKTLQDARQRLRDDILSKEDRTELEPSLKPIEQMMAEVEERLKRFEQARAKVLEAQQAGQPAAEQYRLFQEARELYPDYPNIDEYIERTQDDLAAIAAGEVQDQIVMARRRKEQDAFDEAVTILQTARRHVLANIPHPKPDSSLSQRLEDVARLEEEIATAERDYKNMLATLAEVDELLNQHEEEEWAKALESAHNSLERLRTWDRRDHKDIITALQEVDVLLNRHEREKTTSALMAAHVTLEHLREWESNHPEIQKRRTRLNQLQEAVLLKEKIATADRDYISMIAALGEIEALIHDHTEDIRVLLFAQERLEQFQSHPEVVNEVEKVRLRLTSIQEHFWIRQAHSAKEHLEFEGVFSALLHVRYSRNSNKVTLLALDTVRSFIDEKIQNAREASAQFHFKQAQDILMQAREQLGSWASELTYISSVFDELESLLQEVTEYREAFRDLREANAYREKEQPTAHIDALVQKALSLPYQTPIADALDQQARLLLARESLRQANYEDYKRRLFELLIDNPLNDEVQRRYEWFQKHENYQQWIAALLFQAKVWFWGSIFTALILLGMSIYVILVTVSRGDPLAALSSLVSLIPILATKLVYDQSTAAYERAREVEKRLESESSQHTTPVFEVKTK